MTLLDALNPRPVSQEEIQLYFLPKRKRWRRERMTQAMRQEASERLAAELRSRRQAWADELARDQAKMSALTYPPGIKVVGP